MTSRRCDDSGDDQRSDFITRLDTANRAREALELAMRVRDTLSERHTFRARIAAGGMGTIEIVEDRALDRRVVMKRIHPHLADDPVAVEMFVREAQIAGQLEHPNIVPVHEIGVDQDDAVYFTMKLVEGRTLERTVTERPEGPLSHAELATLLEVVLRVCDALAFAHSRGILHGDVKPANVMIGDFGEVYLMDWGVARRLDDESSSADAPPILIGTASYMAPEQAFGRNDELDERTDVFAVGALLYFVLTRRAPYAGETFWDTVAKAQVAAYPALADAARTPVPRALARIVARAMAIDPDARFPRIADLQVELSRFLRGGDVFPHETFAPGEAIVRQGERGDAAYIIASGRCQVVQRVGDNDSVLREMGPGDVFGEMAILAPGPRTATVVALETTRVHVVTAETLDREVEGMKPWMGAFVRALAQRFREREERAR